MKVRARCGGRIVAVFATAGSWLLLSGPVGAQPAHPLCAALGAATAFPTIALKKLTTNELISYGYWSMGSWLKGSACTQRASLQGTYLYDENPPGPGDLVATATTGSAVRFRRHRTPAYHQVPNSLDGDVITGGGRVTGQPELNENDEEPLIDTSGTRSELSTCGAAFVDAVAASDAFAARPADLAFGRIVVGKDEFSELDVRGASVVQIDELVLEGRKTTGSYGLPHLCDDDGGYLSLYADPGTLINLASLRIGDCATIEAFPSVILNLAGRGKKVRVGIESESYGIHLLAPHRRVEVVGAGSDIGTYFGPVIANRLQVLGYADQLVYDQDCIDDG